MNTGEDIKVGGLTFKRIRGTGRVTCPICMSQVGENSVGKHLQTHDRAREREELKSAGVGSFVKPRPGQLGFDVFGIEEVRPKSGGG